MKRIFALMIALMLIALPALADAMQPFDYTDDILEDGSLAYYFQDLMLKLPGDWAGKLMVVSDDSGVSFYQKASYDAYLEEGLEGGGFLFRLGACVNRSFTELPAYAYLGFSEQSVMNYFLELPSDYPAYMEDSIRAEYDAMNGQIDFIVQNVEFYD